MNRSRMERLECFDIEGCERYKCLADNEGMMNRRIELRLMEQNCLLKKNDTQTTQNNK